MDRNIKVGMSKPCIKSNSMKWKDEDELLNNIDMQIMHVHGIQKKLFLIICHTLWYTITLNFISYLDINFLSEENEYGESFIMYNERDSKNYKANKTKFQPKRFHDVVVS